MFDRQILSHIKECTVAIGLIGKGASFPFQLWGSGFIVNPKGYVMTAGHVSDACLDAIDRWRKAFGFELERAVFFAKRDAKNQFHFYAARIEPRVFRPSMVQKPEGYSMPDNIDVAVYSIGQKKEVPLDHLEIAEPTEIELYGEVAMASYPNGNQSMNWAVNYGIGRRVSPVIQFGRIVNFFPMDDAPIPNGIQTDIIGTGGSSGAAIVDEKGRVVGIALQVISGSVNTGLTYGLSTNVLKKFVDRLDDFFVQRRDDVQTPIEMTVFGEFKTEFL